MIPKWENKEWVIAQSNKALREASGSVSFPASDWLTSLLYSLMRDGVPAGVLERVVFSVMHEDEQENIAYTNGWLALYAKHLADRLRSRDQV